MVDMSDEQTALKLLDEIWFSFFGADKPAAVKVAITALQAARREGMEAAVRGIENGHSHRRKRA